jgi:uncharacterized protein
MSRRPAAENLANDDRLQRLVRDVVETHHPRAVYLFGSRAEGRATPTSDYDLLVVLPSDAPGEAFDVCRAHDSVLRTRVSADIIPTSVEVFMACRHNLSTLEGVAYTRGKLIYGAV